MISKNLWVNKHISKNDLVQILTNNESLAIGKTFSEWLSGNCVEDGTTHFVLVIKEYNSGMWKIHDPGLPPKPERKVNQLINNRDIFGETLIIYGRK